MKKLFLFWLVIFCSLPCLSQTYVDGVDVYSRPKIYSDSFDGYLNIRSTPSAKGNIVGTFRNGQVPGYTIKQEGNWIKIYYEGVTGYVYKKHTSSEPTIEVTVNVDGSWLQGLWEDEDCGVYMLFDNGTYAWDTGYDETIMGTYRLAGNSVVLTPVMYKQLIRAPYGGEYVEDVGYMEDSDSESFVIDVSSHEIGGMKRKEFDPTGEGGSDVTREQFFKVKASVKSALQK